MLWFGLLRLARILRLLARELWLARELRLTRELRLLVRELRLLIGRLLELRLLVGRLRLRLLELRLLIGRLLIDRLLELRLRLLRLLRPPGCPRMRRRGPLAMLIPSGHLRSTCGRLAGLVTPSHGRVSSIVVIHALKRNTGHGRGETGNAGFVWSIFV